MKFIVLFLLLLAGAWFANEHDFFQTDTTVTPNPELIQIVDKCAGIATNAVAKSVVVVEFQKLEVAGRKARVMRNCMQDHGYIENPVWLARNTANALTIAQKAHISENEALENLQRSAMYTISATNNAPYYWLKSTAVTKP